MNVSKDIEATIEESSRRDFFKKTAAYSVSALAASSLLVPTEADATSAHKGKGDPFILEEQPWATAWGTPATDNLYGEPSPYESNVTRRTTELLSSGNMRASIAVTPLQDLSGIITPNGLFFNRNHGGTPEIDYNKHRLMIHGLVEKPLVLTMDELKKYPSVTRIHFIECPANGGPEWRNPQFPSIQFSKGFMSCAEWTGVYIKDILKVLVLNQPLNGCL